MEKKSFMSYFNLKYFYYCGESLAGHQMPLQFFLRPERFTPKTNFFSSNLKSDGREYYCFEIVETMQGFKKRVSFFEDGVNKDIIIKSFDSWVYIPQKYLNHSTVKFQLPVKIKKGYSFSYGIFFITFDKHIYNADYQGCHENTAEAIALLFGYVKLLFSITSDSKKSAEIIRDNYDIGFNRITEDEYKACLRF